jgi:DNA helicase-2/ATP-dependent DNA helicase PcrA
MFSENTLLTSMSPSQREAVTSVKGHFLVLAGAGSGKTRVITHRIAHLLLDHAVPARRILAVTFTNKAAREMRSRVTELLGGDCPPGLWITTFHALGARLLRMESKAAGLDANFTIFDQDDGLRLVKRILKKFGLDPKRNSPSGLRSAISSFKCDLKTPEDAANSPEVFERQAAEIYREYQKELREQSAVDFGDLIVRPVALLLQNEEVRQRYQSRFRYLMVDEYQDTNHAQYRLVRLLAGDRGQVFAVGDEDQSIYGWRGADIRNIFAFQEDFPGTQVIQLEQNYRCPQPVLEAANAMIQNNASRLKEREVFSEKLSPHKVNFYQAWNADEEGKYVSQVIRYLRMEEDLEYRDFAIFYRTHAQARAIEQALLRSRLPYKVFGGPRFFERAVVKDLISYLRLVLNPRDREALGRVINVPRRGIGPKGMEKLLAYASRENLAVTESLGAGVLGGKAGKAAAALQELLLRLREELEGLPPAELLSHLVDSLDFVSHVESGKRPEDVELIDELISAMVDYAARVETPSLRGFLEEAALLSATDNLEEEGGEIHLMTLHNAKGLEFPVVFVTGLEEGLLPHRNSLEPEQLEEERRLFYVGMTRAKLRLFLTTCQARTLYGSTNLQTPSRFLEEIGADHLELGNE